MDKKELIAALVDLVWDEPTAAQHDSLGLPKSESAFSGALLEYDRLEENSHINSAAIQELCAPYGGESRMWSLGRMVKSKAKVYLARAQGGLVKIGSSIRPERRLRELQRTSPVKLILTGVFAGGEPAERALHERFAGLREHGEWFRYSPLIETEANALQKLISSRSLKADLVKYWDLRGGEPVQ